MTPHTGGFGLHEAIASGELWGTLITLALAIVLAGMLAAAVGRRRLLEIAENVQRASHAAQ